MTDPEHPIQQANEQPPSDPSPGRRRFRDEASELLHRVTRLVGEHGDYLSEAAPKLDKLGRDVVKLGARVDDLAEALGEDDDDDTPEDAALTAHGLPRKPRGPICWPVLGPDEAGVMWELLATWLGEVVIPWVGPTRGQLPDCWPVHPEAVSALTWAWETYRGAYTGPAHPAARAEWATRWWPGALEVIRNAIDPAVCPPNWHLMNADQRRDELQQSSDDRARRTLEQGDSTFADAAAAHRQRLQAQEAARRAEEDQKRSERVAERRGLTGAGRPRRLPWELLSDVAERRGESLASRPSAPRLWMPQVREAAAEDLAARRAGAHLTPRTDYSIAGAT